MAKPYDETFRTVYWTERGIPLVVAVRQVAWERRHAVRRAFLSGASRGELAAALGVSISRVRQLVQPDSRRASPIEQELHQRVMREFSPW